LGGGAAEDTSRQLLDVARGDAEFLGKEALARFDDHQVDALDAVIAFEEVKRFLRQHSAAGSDDAQDNDLVFGASHTIFEDGVSLAAENEQVKEVAELANDNRCPSPLL